MKRALPSKSGFTLIELMVVTTIVVLLLLSVSSMFMTFMLSNARTNITRQIKAEGSEMISQMEFVLRNARSTSLSCSAAGSGNTIGSGGVNITDADGNVIVLAYSSNRITLAGKPLNSNFVVSTAPTLTCYQDANNLKTSVGIRFTLSRTADDSSTLQEDFTALTQLRNS